MPVFKIIGADRKTAKPVEVRLTADTADDAEILAQAKGILIKRLIEVEVVTVPGASVASRGKQGPTKLRRVLRGIALAATLVGFLIGFGMARNAEETVQNALIYGVAMSFLPFVYYLALHVNRAV